MTECSRTRGPSYKKILTLLCMIGYQIIESPFGNVVLGMRSGKIVFCHFALPSLEAVLGRVRSDFSEEEMVRGESLLCPGGDVVEAYTFDDLLTGRGSIFRWEDLQVRGTELQVAVWREMFRLQPVELITYSQLAARCGYPRAVRAVASAVGKNPISLIIPCHRVVRSEAFVHRGGDFATEGGSAGKESGKINVSKLGNYYWGKELKIKILEWEELI